MKLIRNILIGAGLLFMSSCLNDEGTDCSVEPGVQAEVPFGIVMANSLRVNLTRAEADDAIKNVDILVFDENSLFLKRVSVNTLAQSAGGVRFTCRLDVSAAARKIHFVINGRDSNGNDRVNFSALTASTTETAAQNLLAAPSVGSGMMAPVMWGKVDVSAISGAMSFTNVKVLRTIAALEVTKGASTTTNGLNDFTLEQFSVWQSAEKGAVIPTSITSGIPTAPSVPTAVASGRVDYCKTPLDLWETPGNRLYVYERMNTATDYLGVIVKASWRGVTGYYKIVLADSNNALLDVVRNHHYVIRITGCSGPGHATLEEAMRYAPSNALNVQVVDDRRYITDMISDGQFELGISSSEFELRGLPANNVILAYLFADCPDPAVITTTGAGSWLSNVRLGTDASGIPCILGDFVGTVVGAAPATLSVRVGTLMRTCTVSWLVPWMIVDIDPDSWVAHPVTTGAGFWSVSVESGMLAFHAYAHAAAGWPSATAGYVSALDSARAADVYMHVARSGSVDPKYFWYTGTDQNKMFVRRVFISN